MLLATSWQTRHERGRIGSESVRLQRDLPVGEIGHGLAAMRALEAPRPQPAVDVRVVSGLKFSVALSKLLAKQTISTRIGRSIKASAVLDERSVVVAVT